MAPVHPAIPKLARAVLAPMALCLALGTLIGAASPQPRGGPSVATRLAWQGWRCDPASPRTGLSCVGRIPGYPRDVAILVPTAYHARARADLILHLHGFNLANHPLAYMLQYFGYAQGLADSGRDAVLIVPLSFGRCDDFNESLADRPEHFKAFVDGAISVLQGAGLVSDPEPASLVLTGHSGAYFPLGSIIWNGVYTAQVRELYLMDATYGNAGDFERFAAVPGHRFWSAYHTSDPGMNEVNPEIMRYLRGDGVAYDLASRPDVPPAELARNPVGFVVSDVAHDPTSIKYFPMFLK